MKLPKYEQFLKISKAVSILSNTLVIIFLGLGYSEDSLILLISRVGISGLMSIIEVFYDKNKQNGSD